MVNTESRLVLTSEAEGKETGLGRGMHGSTVLPPLFGDLP